MTIPMNLPIEKAEILTLTEPLAFLSDNFTFIYLISGSLHVTELSVSFECHSGDIFLLNPEQECQINGSHSTILRLSVEKGFVESILGIYRSTHCNSALNQQTSFLKIKQLVCDIYEQSSAVSEQNLFLVYSSLFSLLHEIAEFNYNPLQQQRLSDAAQDRIITIIDYIERHYAEHLTLSQLAETVFLTPQYLSAYFSKNFDMTFHQYLTQIRLHHARITLTYTDSPLSEIAVNTGFSNSNILYKNFCKAYGMSPSGYRKKFWNKNFNFQNKNSHFQAKDFNFEQDSDSVSEQKQAQTNRPASYSQQTAISCQLDGTAFYHHYRMINIGSASNLLSEKYRRLLQQACRTSHFQYVRIQEVISNAFIPMIMPSYTYSYQKCDQIFTFLHGQHLIPVIELSRLPFDYNESAIIKGEVYSVSHGNRFLQLLDDFMKHCANKWGLDWIRQWKFEFWFSPHMTLEKYCENFKAVENIIHSYTPDIQMGGPGYSESVQTISPEALIFALSEKKIPFDFFSVNLNLLQQKNGRPVLNADPSYCKNFCLQIKALLKKYMHQIPLFVTEWTSANIALPLAQSCFQSAFIIKNVLELSSLCELSGYWLLCDVKSPLLNFYRKSIQNHWGSGLIGKDDVLYPAYYSFKLLHQLGQEVIAKGHNYIVFRLSPHHFQILAFHYVHFASDASYHMEEYNFNDVYHLFEDEPEVTIHFDLKDLPDGLYQITRTTLNRQHGSLLDLSINEYEESNLSAAAFFEADHFAYNDRNQYRIQACVPFEERFFIQIENTLSLTAQLSPHTVILWNVVKQL